jgi:hypothetical protein
MKKMCFSTVFLLVVMVAWTQNPVKRTVKIGIDEVPVAVRTAFERDFGTIQEGGDWMVHFAVELIEERSVAKPVWYGYTIKNKTEKGEARYTPDGKLIFAKGLNRINS